LTWLACSVAEASWALQVDRAAMTASWIGGLQVEVRLRLIPPCIAMGMVGLVLAATPPRRRRRPAAPTPRARWAWASAIWAGLAGVAMVATAYGVFPYLVLIAIDAVSNAMTRPPIVPRVPLVARLARAGLESAATVAAALATAAWLAEDLRGAARDPASARKPRSWAGVAARSATAAATAGGGTYLLFATIPRVQPWLAEGLWMIVDPAAAATIVCGFAGLAAGIAARSAAHLAGAEGVGEAPAAIVRRPRAWPPRLLGAAGCLVAAEVAASAILKIRGDEAARWYVPWSLSRWLEALRYPTSMLGVPGSPPGPGSAPDNLGELLLLGAAPWLAIRLLALVAGGTSGPPAPLDVVAGDRLAFGRFLGWWAALAGLMLAALPTMAVAGVALTGWLLRRFAG